MTYTQYITEGSLSIQEIVHEIQRRLIFENLVDEEEFNERFESFEEAWKNFVDNQEIGDCQEICSPINFKGLSNVKSHFGEIEVDEPSTDFEDGKENYMFTHHWLSIDGQIYEFSKGTLKNNIEWDDLYGVENEGEYRYNEL